MNARRWIDLECHAATRSEAARAVQVLVRRSANAVLQITYRVVGDVSRIRVPPPAAPRIGSELWRHTCFEAFIAVDGQAAYHEFNFAPSGEWTIYAFRSYRDGGPLADETMRPHIAVRSSASRLELNAAVRLDRLSDAHPRAALRIGLAALIETGAGLSCWALRHPAATPDFHDAAGFALLLGPPDGRS